MLNRWALRAALVFALSTGGCGDGGSASRPVSFSWLGVSHWMVETPVGGLLLDAYMSRPPFGPTGPNTEGLELLRRIETAIRPMPPIRWIVVGHSHFDHALDVGVLAEDTGADVIGSRTTCLIAESQGLPADRCTAVAGGERLTLDPRLEVRVVRVPHSSPDSIGLFADLDAPPANALGAPNGGNLGFLFVLKYGGGRTRESWFYTNSIAPITSDDGSDVDFPAAMSAAFADAESPSVWFGAPFGSATTLAPYLDFVRPRFFVPHHFDGLTQELTAGVPGMYSDPVLAAELAGRGAELLTPAQYLDRVTILDGEASIDPDEAVKRAIGVPVP